MATYFAACQAAGINACWIDLFGDDYFFNGRSDWGLKNGTDPFTATLGGGEYDFTSPNETFFLAVDAMLILMATYGLCCFLNVYDQAGNLSEYTANGTTRVQSLGTFLGTRYKTQQNIVWFVGNDFQTWRTQADSDLTLALMNAILAADPTHLMMTQNDYPLSGSLDNTTTAAAVSLAGAYAYNVMYSYVRGQFESVVKTVPVMVQETWAPNHTFQDNGTTLPPSMLVMRKQAYWGMLSGALAGYLSGNDMTDGFNTGWQTAFTVGYAQFAAELRIWWGFFTSLAWYTLTSHDWPTASIGTAGRGTYATSASADTNDYVPIASDATSDIRLLIAYFPKAATLTVDMTKMHGSTVARWFDPTNGTYTAIGTFAASGTHNFVTPGNNSAGSVDWILRLDA